MLYPLWSAKGGSGCTAVAAALATVLVDHHRSDVLVVDLGGDVPAAAGVADPDAGVTDWLAAPDAADDALRRLEVPLGRGVQLLPRGSASLWDPARGDLLRRLLQHDERAVVVDVSVVGPRSAAHADAMVALRRGFAGDEHSVLVTQACYLAMRRRSKLAITPGGVALLREPRGTRRSLDRFDVADLVGAPVVAEIDRDPAVARALDAGRILAAAPRPFARQVRRLAR